jgi:3-oxoadipate enol-lactonase
MQLYHQQAGAGPAVVLLHAGICDSRMWDPQWVTFPPTHQTIRYDQRGYGRSPLPPGSWSDARDLIGLLEGLGIQRAALVGVSRGGRIALELAVARPDLVAALVLVGAGLPGHAWSESERLQAPVWEVLEDRIQLLVPDLAGRLGQVRAPTLVLAGEQDLADVRAIAKRLAREIGDARHAMIEGAAHLPSLERPAEFDDLVLGFLAEVERARST